MPVKSLVFLMLFWGGPPALACRRAALIRSVSEIKAVVNFLHQQKNLSAYQIEKIEMEKNRFAVTLASGEKTCVRAFKVISDPSCTEHVEPVGKVACP